MTGLTQALNIGVTGLQVASEGMQTVSNNTANANTPGYNVESINQVELNDSPFQGGGIGLGAQVTSIQRGFSQFAFQQLVKANGANQSAQTLLSNAQNLAAMFPIASGGANGLGSAIDGFFGAANTVSQDPSSMPNRQVMLGSAQTLVAGFHTVGAELTTDLNGTNQQITSAVTQINQLSKQIASLNTTLASVQGNTSANATNSLQDQRDQLVQQLSQQIGVSTITGSDGSVDIYAAGGTALVNGSNSYNLIATSGAYLDGNIEVAYATTGQDLTGHISGGALGGLVAFRSQLTAAANQIGALATSFAASVNAQQAQGLDLSGNLGTALFNSATPAVYDNSANTGGGSINASITSVSGLVPDTLVVTKTAGGFQATDTVTGQTTALGAGPNFTINGMSLTASGTINVGDSFEIEPVVNAAGGIAMATSDPTKIAAASPYVATAGALTSGGAIVDQNTGNVTATVGGPSAVAGLPAGTVLIPSTYFGQEISIAFTSSTSFNVLSSGGATIGTGTFAAGTGAEVAVQYPAGGPPGQAVTIALSPGNAVTGDSYVISPGGPGNGGNIVSMAGLAGSNLISNQTLSQYYAQIVSSVGNNGQQAQIASQASQSVFNSATTIQQSISGVNLDEEAALLVQYQQAYQASAQVIATSQTLLNDLLSAIQSA